MVRADRSGSWYPFLPSPGGSVLQPRFRSELWRAGRAPSDRRRSRSAALAVLCVLVVFCEHCPGLTAQPAAPRSSPCDDPRGREPLRRLRRVCARPPGRPVPRVAPGWLRALPLLRQATSPRVNAHRGPKCIASAFQPVMPWRGSAPPPRKCRAPIFARFFRKYRKHFQRIGGLCSIGAAIAQTLTRGPGTTDHRSGHEGANRDP